MYPQINKSETGIKLRKMMDVKGVSATDVQKYLGLGCVQSVYRWFSGVSMPTVDNLYALSKLLGVSVDELLCGDRTRNVEDTPSKRHSTCEERIYIYYQKINEKCVV